MASIEQLHIPIVEGEHPDIAHQVQGAVGHTLAVFDPDDPGICMSASLALVCGSHHIDSTEITHLRSPEYSGRRIVEIAQNLRLEVWQMDSQRELFNHLTDDPPHTVAAVVVYVYEPPVAHAVGLLRSHTQPNRWYLLDILRNPFLEVLNPESLQTTITGACASVVLRKKEE